MENKPVVTVNSFSKHVGGDLSIVVNTYWYVVCKTSDRGFVAASRFISAGMSASQAEKIISIISDAIFPSKTLSMANFWDKEKKVDSVWDTRKASVSGRLSKVRRPF
jgi:hypothetical protein